MGSTTLAKLSEGLAHFIQILQSVQLASVGQQIPECSFSIVHIAEPDVPTAEGWICWGSGSNLLQRWNGSRNRCRQSGIRQLMQDLLVGAIDRGLLIFTKNYLNEAIAQRKVRSLICSRQLILLQYQRLFHTDEARSLHPEF